MVAAGDGGRIEWLARRCESIRRRGPMALATEGRDAVLAEAGLAGEEVDHIATTGEGENVKFATGHFYSMTTHARGGVYLVPDTQSEAYTQFTFTAFDSEPETRDPKNAIITIQCTGPNGDESLSISGISR